MAESDRKTWLKMAVIRQKKLCHTLERQFSDREFNIFKYDFQLMKFSNTNNHFYTRMQYFFEKPYCSLSTRDLFY